MIISCPTPLTLGEGDDVEEQGVAGFMTRVVPESMCAQWDHKRKDKQETVLVGVCA